MLRIIVGIGALQIAAVALNLLRSKVVAVLLGPQGVGAIGVVDQLVQLVLYVSTLSLPLAAVRFLSKAHSESSESFKDTYGSFLRTLLVLTTVGVAVGGVVAFFRPDLLGPDLGQYRFYLLPALVSIPAMACQGLFSNVLAAAGRTRAAAAVMVVVAAALTIAALVGIHIGGILGLYWGNLFAAVLLTVGVAIYLRQSLNLPFLPRGRNIREELSRNPDLVALTFTFYASTIASSLALFVARYAVLDHFGEYEAGLLQAGLALFVSLNAVLSRPNAVYLMPVVHRRTGADEKMRQTYEFVRKHWLVILLATMPVVLFAPWVLELLYSPAFLALGGTLTLLVTAQCLQILSGNNYILLMGLDDLGAFGLLSVIGYASVGALAWMLAPAFGIVGVGIGFLGGFAISYALATGRLVVRHGMHIEARWWWYLGYGLLALGIGGLVAAQLDPWNPAVIVVKGAAYLVFAITLLRLLDRDELRELIVVGQRLLFPSGTHRAGRTGASVFRRATQPFFPEAWESTPHVRLTAPSESTR